MRVSYQGVPGAYSEAALNEIFAKRRDTFEAVPCDSFESVFLAVVDGRADRALVPIENNLGGSIHCNYDLQLKHRLFITAEMDFRVRHALMAMKGVRFENVTTVYSHTQALAQCDDFIRRHGFSAVAQFDTAGSAKIIADQKLNDVAAIASTLAASTYGLEILAEGIEDERNNFTRFILLSAKEEVPPLLNLSYKTSLVFALHHNEAGLLFKALAVFALRDIDLTKIESRPGKSLPSESLQASNAADGIRYKYFMYMDLAAHSREKKTQNALRHLAEMFSFIRVFGTYIRSSQTIESPASSPSVSPIRQKKFRIGIIGFGGFGQFLAKRFVNDGAEVLATSRTDYSSLAKDLGVQFFPTVEEFAKQFLDVVIFSVSILSFDGSIKKFPFHLLQDSLIVDVLSVKTHSKLVMEECVPARMDILCTHPMFGPESGASSWQDLPFVYEIVRVRDKMRCQTFLDIWRRQGCRMHEMSCEKHDAYAASSQFITHFTGRVLEQLKMVTTPINTKGFERLLQLVENTSKDSIDLFTALFQYNPNSQAQLQAFEAAFCSVRKQLLSAEDPHQERREELELNELVQRSRSSGTVGMTEIAQELSRTGISVITLSVGEPSWRPPKAVEQAAISAITNGQAKYTSVAGLPELRDKIAAKLNRDQGGKRWSAANIVVSNGAKQAVFQALKCLLRTGDEVVIPRPCWPSYEQMVLLCGGKAVFAAADTAEHIDAVITARTRLLILCNPNNPSGLLYDREQIQAIAQVVRHHPRLFVLSDEIYEMLCYDGEHIPFASVAGMQERTITINGFSKSFAMTGFRVGYLAAVEPLVAACVKVQGHITTCASSISQHAAIAALDVDVDELAPHLVSLRRRRDLVISYLSSVAGLRLQCPRGAFYAFPDVSALLGRHPPNQSTPLTTDTQLCEYLLKEFHVAVVPGSVFSSPGSFRISFAQEDEILEKALQRIVEFLNSLVP